MLLAGLEGKDVEHRAGLRGVEIKERAEVKGVIIITWSGHLFVVRFPSHFFKFAPVIGP